jgi:phage gp16-like protein
MSAPLTFALDKLTPQERHQLEQLAAKAGMTVAEWVEYAQKAQIYHNAQERLTGNAA